MEDRIDGYTRAHQLLAEPPDIIEATDNGVGTVTTYVGYAGMGTQATTDSTWLIVKFVEVTAGLVVTTTKQYSNGCLLKNVAWSDRATLTYAYLQKS